ncbi:MAG TPA: hypothetical protein VFJ12_03495 [Segeticoccus sp.]|nr:hypothetical protein [Segeticoccus sp.]
MFEIAWVALVGPAPGPVTVVLVSAVVILVLLALLLVSGWQRRWVGKALAGLFTVYVGTMGLGGGPGELASYGMPVLVGGALLVSASPARRRSRRPGHHVAVGPARSRRLDRTGA